MPPFRGECLQCHEDNVFVSPTDYELKHLLIQHHYATKEIFDGDGCTLFEVTDESTGRQVKLNELGGELYLNPHHI